MDKIMTDQAIDLTQLVATIITLAYFIYQSRLLRIQSQNAQIQLKALQQQTENSEQQLALFKKQLKADHERSQKIYAIDILERWINANTEETSMAVALFRRLNPEQIKKIANQETLSVSKESENLLKFILADSFDNHVKINVNDHTLELDLIASKKVRFLGTKYLNSLETALSAWRQGIADKDFLAEQFKFTDQNKAAIQFRQELKNASFPSIEAFLAANAPIHEEEISTSLP